MWLNTNVYAQRIALSTAASSWLVARERTSCLLVDSMYGFGRLLRRLCTLALLQGFTCGVFAGGNQTVETFQVIEDVGADNGYFSPPWLEQYDGEHTGCELGRGGYTWRLHGLGSNINNMLEAWVYFLAVEGWSDISVICDDTQLQHLVCSDESAGLVSHGWDCLFSSMPHVCVFDTAKAWTDHMISAKVSEEDLYTAGNLTLNVIRESSHTQEIVDSLQELNIDHLGSLAVMAQYMWRYITPWLRNDVDFVVHAEKAVEGLPFLGIHVRRGDKLRREAIAFDAEEYLKAAVAYAKEETTQTGVDDIKAIWVASDDPAIVDEVRTLAPTYFPSVINETIVYVAGGVAGGPNTTGVDTHTRSQRYGSFVYILADLEQLAAADVFVGTFSSNVGRLVVLLREGLGKPRISSISLDKESWYPGRQRGLMLH